MEQEPVRDLNEITGVTLQSPWTPEQTIVLSLLKATLPAASELAFRAVNASALSPFAIAASAALHSIVSLVAVAAPQCNLNSPPEDIDVRIDGSGKMIYRCRHSLPHEWDLSGNLLR